MLQWSSADIPGSYLSHRSSKPGNIVLELAFPRLAAKAQSDQSWLFTQLTQRIFREAGQG